MTQSCNQEGQDLIKFYEGCRLSPYLDTRGILTVGYGHTGPDVVFGETWSQDQVDAMFLRDLEYKAEIPLNEWINVDLSDTQFSALCSFCYNVGPGAFKGSHLLAVLNQSNFQAVGGELLLWDHNHDGSINAGLKKRREAELELWLKG